MKRQHEPLRVPRGWTDQDKALVIQLNSLLDRVYEVQGKLEDRIGQLGDASNMGVANNLTTTDSGFLLDARQGPIIKDMLGSLTGPAKIIESAINFNDYLTVGTYAIMMDVIAAACTNKPCSSAGRLIVWEMGNTGIISGQYIYGGQFYVSYHGDMYHRWINTNSSNVVSYGPWVAYFYPPTSASMTSSLATGYTVSGGYIYRIGNMAHVKFSGLKQSTADYSSWQHVATLPSWAMPYYEQNGCLMNDSNYTNAGHTVYEMKVLENGQVHVWGPKNGVKMWGGLTYICG